MRSRCTLRSLRLCLSSARCDNTPDRYHGRCRKGTPRQRFALPSLNSAKLYTRLSKSTGICYLRGNLRVKLDVVVPTYNRSQLLKLTVDSLLQARVPEGMQVAILVVDNNSKDNTEQLVREIQKTAKIPVHYVKATRQGLSHARNAGIEAGSGDVIGFIDDDEEVNRDWYEVVGREFSDEKVEFIGGPYLANCKIPMPGWIPPGYHAVIGVVDPKPRQPFGPSFSGNLMGGNAVIRRDVFDRVGTYSPKLGRSGKGLLSEEDAEFYRRLMAADILGYHVPELIIHHHIPQDRLTKKYHRRWCYWRGFRKGFWTGI